MTIIPDTDMEFRIIRQFRIISVTDTNLWNFKSKMYITCHNVYQLGGAPIRYYPKLPVPVSVTVTELPNIPTIEYTTYFYPKVITRFGVRCLPSLRIQT